MTYYDCEEIICEQLSQYFQALLKEKKIDIREITAEHNALLAKYPDLYSNALLRTGIPRLTAPIFSNPPSKSFKWEINRNLARIFEALGMPSTQQEAYRFASLLKRKSVGAALSSKQRAQLEDLDFLKTMVDEISIWCEKARKEVDAMSANIPLLATVTEEEKEFANALRFDWYYDYIDELSRYREAKEGHRLVAKDIQQRLAEKPHLQKVVNVVASAYGFSPSFFTTAP